MPQPGAFTLGLSLPQVIDSGDRIDPGTARRFIVATEEAGFDTGWVLDQVSGQMPSLEPLSVLSFASALTQELTLGVAVLVLAARSPVNAAKAIATLDQLSGGRLVLGLGLGALHHMGAHGLGGEPPGRILDEELDLLETAWSGSAFTSQVGPFDIDSNVVTPGPVGGARPRVWFGGASQRAMDRAVGRGDGWVAAGRTSVEEAEADLARMCERLEAHGRPRETFTTAKRLYVVVDVDVAGGRARARDWFGRFYGRPEMSEDCVIAGGAGPCTEAVHRLAEAGYDHVILNPLGAETDQQEILAGEVLPVFLPTSEGE